MIDVRKEVRARDIDTRRLKSAARLLLGAIAAGNATLAISLVDDVRMRGLNLEHRGANRPTDVLSFPLEGAQHAQSPIPSPPLGDIVISIDTARRQAAEYDAPLQNEVYRLLIHGLLHVIGYDHETPKERSAMEAEERRLASVIGMPWPYD